MTGLSRGRARIGVLVPFTNVNLEADLSLLRLEGVSFHIARLGDYDQDAIPDADQMATLGEAALDEPLRLVGGAKPDYLLYGCTSATLTHGRRFDEALVARMARLAPRGAITAASALVGALRALGARRVAFASPYVAAINDDAVAFLADCGVETVGRAELDAPLDCYGQGALTPDEVFALGRRADRPEAEAIVLSCTDMRSVEVIERLEAETGKPVVASNQAMLFAAYHALGLDMSGLPAGRLYRASALAA